MSFRKPSDRGACLLNCYSQAPDRRLVIVARSCLLTVCLASSSFAVRAQQVNLSIPTPSSDPQEAQPTRLPQSTQVEQEQHLPDVGPPSAAQVRSAAKKVDSALPDTTALPSISAMQPAAPTTDSSLYPAGSEQQDGTRSRPVHGCSTKFSRLSWTLSTPSCLRTLPG